jgi:dephospho-CoA kinase
VSEPTRPPRRLVLIGLTGPIGCGKSTVARQLAALGGAVIDADVLAREVTATGAPTLPAIRRRFGDGVFGADDSLDRAALAELVFDDPAALADLEAIVHPAVRQRVDAELAAARASDPPFIVIEAIKLVEGGLAERCDEVWLIDCPPEAQHRRLLGRGMSAADARRRTASQGGRLVQQLAAALEGRLAYRRVSTDGTLADTTERVEDALADVLGRLG